MTTRRVCPGARPRSASSSSRISATARTYEASGTLGRLSAATAGPTAASMSRTAMRHGRLMRTTTSTPWSARRSAAAATAARASSLRAGGMASSRSSWMQSAPRAAAPATNFSFNTGTKSMDRHSGSSRPVKPPIPCCDVPKPSSMMISSVCSPSSGAGRRKVPGVGSRRGTISCMGTDPRFLSSSSVRAPRPAT